MALLTFPPSPLNGDYYPVSPLPGQSQYRWSAVDSTWRLEGVATGVIPGVYGSASQIPILTIDFQGRTTTASFADISTVYIKTNNPTAFNSYVWPNADGANGYSLQTDGSGNLSWKLLPPVTGTAPIVVTSTPAGSVVSITNSTTTSVGAVQLATSVETQTGTNTTKAVTPSSLQSKVSDSVAITSSTTIASSTAVKTAYDLANNALPLTGGTMTGAITTAPAGIIFSDASTVVAISDSTSTTSSTTAASSTAVKTAYNLANDALPKSGGTMTGAITTAPAGVIFSDASTVVAISDSTSTTSSTTAASSTAVKAAYDLAAAAIPKSTLLAKGSLVGATAAGTPADVTVGTDGQYLKADSTAAAGVSWSNVQFVQFDDISASFDGVVVAFPLTVGAVAKAPVPSTNIMVYLGGVAQTPGAGNAYTVTGSTITFNSAPLAGTFFYAVTIG